MKSWWIKMLVSLGSYFSVDSMVDYPQAHPTQYCPQQLLFSLLHYFFALPCGSSSPPLFGGFDPPSLM